ncbi:MAG: phosphatase PAP2 family protein [Candidatus Eisenbacteria bacterium]
MERPTRLLSRATLPAMPMQPISVPQAEAQGASRRGTRSRRLLKEILVVVACLIAVTSAIELAGWDLALSRAFYDPAANPAWWGRERQPLQFLYDYGTWPALAVGIGSLFLLPATWFVRRLRPHRRSFALLALVLALGPGLVVNTALKDHWGRPRPRELREFGGTAAYQGVEDPGTPGKGKAFPSGHASMGFYFVSFYILWRDDAARRDRAAGRRASARATAAATARAQVKARASARARAALAFGILAGCAIGLQRIASGGHFLTDVLWAGGIVYLVALLVDFALPATPELRRRPNPGTALARPR